MIKVKKVSAKEPKYCTHCDKPASYLLYFTNPIVGQQGCNGAFCKKCFSILSKAMDKVKDLK